MLNITAMNIGTQKPLWYAYCMIEHSISAATAAVIYDASKLLENNYVMEWIYSLRQY